MGECERALSTCLISITKLCHSCIYLSNSWSQS